MGGNPPDREANTFEFYSPYKQKSGHWGCVPIGRVALIKIDTSIQKF